MDDAGIDYLRKDNCFVRVSDLAKAQELLTAQVHANWPVLLEELARRSNPLEETLLPLQVPYYWAVQQSEWAADVLFQWPEQLQSAYPLLVRHAMEHFHSRDVLRFLGHRTTAKGTGIYANYSGEASSHLKERPEGVRVRHSAANGECKMYDKEGEILRPEATLTKVSGFRVERTKEGDEQGKKDRRSLRKGVVDMALRAEVSQRIADRYMDALASVTISETLAEQWSRDRVEWQRMAAKRNGAENLTPPVCAPPSHKTHPATAGNGLQTSIFPPLSVPPGRTPRGVRNPASAPGTRPDGRGRVGRRRCNLPDPASAIRWRR